MAPSPATSAVFRLLLRRTTSHSRCGQPSALSLSRSMGGGSRTFPGGINKWQWKRQHEKKAAEKERKLLDHERQLYQARLRSQIRAEMLRVDDGPPPQGEQFGAMSPEEHVKALADRFMKPGAEDLWNEDDGPLTEPKCERRARPRMAGGLPQRRQISGTDLRDLVPGRSSSTVLGGRKGYHTRCGRSVNFGIVLNSHVENEPVLYQGRRFYAVKASKDSRLKNKFRMGRNSSSEESDDDAKAGNEARSNNRFRMARNSSSEEDDDDDDDDDESANFDVKESGIEGGFVLGRGRSVKEMMSSAALMKHDRKKDRRFTGHLYDEEDLSTQVRRIREELKMRSSISEEKVVKEEEDQVGEEDTLLSDKRFDECNISPLTVKALSSAGYFQMTKVQDATLSACLEGKDAMVKAKEGTGKSVAFLLLAVEAAMKASSSSNNQRVTPIRVLILSPTRELASQIAAEANVLLRYHNGIGVQTLIGGTRFKEDLKCLESNPCQIIVATPGRLLDHIENRSGFSTRLMGLKMLVLDEADHLLDLGFRKDVEKLVDCIPRQRQTILFTATVPKEVRRVSQLVLKKEHDYINTSGIGCPETNSKVLQSCMISRHENHFHIVYHILKEHIIRVLDYKVIIFCTTAMVTSLLFLLLRDFKFNVRETHARKPQIYRNRISEEFRESMRLILVTSDVSARGMNYPDVSLVIQVGMPIDREQYIHRLGRTGRQGKDGEGILLLAPWEEYFLDDLKDLPVTKSQPPEIDSELTNQVKDIMKSIDSSIKEGAYHAWLGYYNSIREISRNKTMLVEWANQFCHSIYLEKPPALFRKTAIKMGLKDISGIRIRK